jgi:hypothetical protein
LFQKAIPKTIPGFLLEPRRLLDTAVFKMASQFLEPGSHRLRNLMRAESVHGFR